MINLNKVKYFFICLTVFSIFIFPIISLAQNFDYQINSNSSITPPNPNVNPIIIDQSQTQGQQIVTPQLEQPVVQNNSSSGSSSSSSASCTSITSNSKLGNLFDLVSCIISRSVIPAILALGVALFVWGVVQYVINSDDEAKKAKGRDFMIWGIIALTVMVSVWGLVNIVGNTFGITNVIPRVNTQ